MKERKMMKKVFALVLSFAMLLTMSTTVFAADSAENNSSVPATRTSADTVAVTVAGLDDGVSVTLYQIAEGNYQTVEGTESFKDYAWVDNADVAALKAVAESGAITATEVTAVVNAINAGTVNAISTKNGTAADGKCAFTVGAGAYIAVITGGGETIYNPVFLTATYDEAGQFVGGTVDLGDAGEKLYGNTAVAKKSEPSIDKEITGGTVADGDKDTVNVGATVSYSITPTLPSYPENAVNKTLVVTDTLSAGLTLDASSVKITLGGANLTYDEATSTFKNGDVVVATMAIDGQKMYFDFEYNTLIADETSGATAAVVITYNAVVNENAVVGTAAGNPNDVELFYTNDPSQGDDYDLIPGNPEDPEGTTVESKTDSETVYTYQVAFKKVDENGDALAGATFGIYSDSACTQLVDTVVTDAAGLAVSSKVAAGTYYIKEITPPTGYSLNTTVYDVEAVWTSVTNTVSNTTTTCEYTANSAEALNAVQAGWLVAGQGTTSYITAEAYAALSVAEQANYVPAYLKDTVTTTSASSTVTENQVAGGVAMLGTEIPNTPMASLPSTGGVGTFIFTIAGCLIMVAAVAIFMVSKKKASN